MTDDVFLTVIDMLDTPLSLIQYGGLSFSSMNGLDLALLLDLDHCRFKIFFRKAHSSPRPKRSYKWIVNMC
jgi:hypothetical protein